MYIPKEIIAFILGYITCPITAYIYFKLKKGDNDDNI